MKKNLFSKITGIITLVYCLLDIICNIFCLVDELYYGGFSKTFIILKLSIFIPALIVLSILLIIKKGNKSIIYSLLSVELTIFLLQTIMGFGDSYVYGANIGPIIPFLILATITLLCIKDDVNDLVKKESKIDNEKCIALLKQYKELLETNAISKEDYEKIKNDILNKKEN